MGKDSDGGEMVQGKDKYLEWHIAWWEGKLADNGKFYYTTKIVLIVTASFHKYLLNSLNIQIIVLGTGNIIMHKEDMIPALMECIF